MEPLIYLTVRDALSFLRGFFKAEGYCIICMYTEFPSSFSRDILKHFTSLCKVRKRCAGVLRRMSVRRKACQANANATPCFLTRREKRYKLPCESHKLRAPDVRCLNFRKDFRIRKTILHAQYSLQKLVFLKILKSKTFLFF